MRDASAPAWIAGVMLVLSAMALVFWVPGRGELVFTVQSSGANEVRVPVAYWLIVSAWLVAVARAIGARLPAVAPRAIVVGFVTHLVVLLVDFSFVVRSGIEFTSPAYHAYARAFSAAMLAAVVAAAIAIFRRQSATTAIDLPIVPLAVIFAGAMLWLDPLPAAVAIVVGIIGSRMTGTLGAWAPRVREAAAGDRGFMLAIFLVALALRLLYLQRVMSNPGYVETGADGPVYDELAWSIAQGRGVRESFTERFPLLILGYVWFVSVIYRVAGHSYFAVGAVQAVIGSAACVMFYRLAKQLFGQAVARTAAWFAVISFPLLFAAAAIGHQAIDVFLTVAIVWLLVNSGASSTWWRWAAIGVLFGLAIAVRETVAFFLAFVVMWIPFLFARPRSWRAVGAAAVVIVACAATLAPMLAPKVATEAGRDKLRHHFDLLYRGEMDPIRMRDDLVAPLQNPDAALSQLREQPGLVLGTLGRAWASNFAVQFFSQPYGGFDLIFLLKGTAYYYSLWFYAYALAAAGAVLLIRRVRADAQAAAIVLVLGLIVSRTLPHVILESNYRHRVPIEPFLILLASVTAVGLVRSMGGSREPVAA